MEEKKKRVSRWWRTTTVLTLGVVIGTVLMATPAGSHIGTVTHLWNAHIKPKADARYVRTPSKYVVANGSGPITGTLGARTILCPTAVYTPTGPQTAYINTTTGQIGGAGGSTIATRAAYSADGGSTYLDAFPQWAVGATAPDGDYATNTNFGVVNLTKGTQYTFALSGYIFAGSNATGGDCKVVVEITPRKAGSGLLPRPAALTRARSSRAN